MGIPKGVLVLGMGVSFVSRLGSFTSLGFATPIIKDMLQALNNVLAEPGTSSSRKRGRSLDKPAKAKSRDSQETAAEESQSSSLRRLNTKP